LAQRPERLTIGPVAFLVAGLAFMENLDGAILPTAAPTIARSFHILSSQLGICVTAYIVSVVSFIPVAAWLVEKYGVRPVLFSSIVVFVVASLLCAASTNLTELTLMRILQGVGASAMVPVGRLVVFQSTTKSEMVRAVSYLVWPGLTAPVIAPVIGGLIVSNTSWHWIFIINLPIGIVALIVGYKIIPRIGPGQASKLDWFGFIGLTISLTSLVFAAAQVGLAKVNVPLATSLFLLGILSALPTIRHLIRSSEPLVDLAALKIHTFRTSNGTGTIYRVAHSFAPFLLPLLFQDKFHWSASRSGAILFFYMIGNLGFKVATKPLMRRFRFRPLLIATTILSALAIFGIVLIGARTPIFWVGGLLVACGSIRSLGMTLYATLTFADIESEMLPHANTLYSMIGQLTTSFGVALAVVSLKLGGSFFSPAQEFKVAFLIAVALMVISFIGLIPLSRTAGDSLR